MRRAVVFAHYDKDSIIDDYVIYYLKELKKISDTIVFVSCCNLADKEIEKLNGIASHVITQIHDEYDFGSYKRGFLYLQDKLNEFDELIFANDSCYGPLYPLEKVFSKMENEHCDFWGITKNNFGYKKNLKHFFVKRPHVQSYFIVFKQKIFTQDFFADFMQSIKHLQTKKEIISKYEIGLTELLKEKGFKFKTFINAYENINNITILKWRQIIEKYQMPFIKCSLPRLVNRNSTTVEGWEKIVKQAGNYPIDLINRNIARTKMFEHSKYSLPERVKVLYFNLIAGFPFPIRKTLSIIIKHCFPFLRD